ncbi:MAG: hypothetical protein H0V62_06905 [Gammaproteobacteria bacterium]|nr:hypothetical protein [Gammaproteobacteria bacterium]
MTAPETLTNLRRAINENLRVQRGGADPVPYIDVGNILNDIGSRQNHAVFARRGCGKTLLLHHSSRQLDSSIKSVYLNCEDFKRHSFPNVLIEILDALFGELERHLTGWFGKKKRSRALIADIRKELGQLRIKADMQEQDVRESVARENSAAANASAGVSSSPASLRAGAGVAEKNKAETERTYRILDDKIRELDIKLPKLKAQVREFFDLSTAVKGVFLQIDDFYHQNQVDQPLVMDYIHRLCKDLPLYFKIATLKHATTLFADRDGQPIGAQERHDYQPINIDFTFSQFQRTKDQNRRIFHEFGSLAGMRSTEFDALFRGEGFERLVLAGGGVPRDCLSMFLEVLEGVQPPGGDGRIGKDDIRILSRSNFERRIEELKQDSEGREQNKLIRGIYVLRKFCLDKKTNVFLVSEQMMQQEDQIRGLIYRLLDYRIIHGCGSALTHKSRSGTFQAFAIDIGCYAHMRKLHGRFTEVDLAGSSAKERMRSAPILNAALFDELWREAPADAEGALFKEDQEAA